MEMKWVSIKGQKFEIGRTINPMKCGECKSCDYMNCKNYAVRMKQSKYTIKEWLEFYSDEIKKPFSWDFELLGMMFDELITFPKGLYWDYDKFEDNIRFVTMSRYGHEHVVGKIRSKDSKVVYTDIDISPVKRKFLDRVCNTMLKVEASV